MAWLPWSGPTLCVADEAAPAAPASPEQARLVARATALSNKAVELYSQGKFAEALPPAKEAAKIYQQALGKRHPDYANSLGNLASICHAAGDNEHAEPLYLLSLQIFRDALGERHPRYALALNNLAEFYRANGDFPKAEPLYRRAIEIRGQVLGKKHPDYAVTLNNLGGLYYQMGDPARAEPLFREAIEIQKHALGEWDPTYASSLSNLGALYQQAGDYGHAEPLLRKAMEIKKKVLGARHPEYAESLNNLAALHKAMGDYVKAEPLYTEALEIWKGVLGEHHPDYATGLCNLAELYVAMENYAKAEPLIRQAVAINRDVLGPRHPDYAISLYSLSKVLELRGEVAKAEPLLLEAMEIFQPALGERHPFYSACLSNLAHLHLEKGEYAKAEKYMRQAIDTVKQTAGEKNPQFALVLNNLAVTLVASGKPADALPVMRQAWDISLSERNHVLTFGTERQQAEYLGNAFQGRSGPLTLVCEYLASDPAARQFAAAVVLADKGAALEALAQRQAAALAAADPALKEPYLRWQGAGAALTRISLATPSPARSAAYQQRLAELQEEFEAADKALSLASIRFTTHAQADRVGLEQVFGALRQGSALVDFARYRRVDFNPKVPDARGGSSHYVALVIRGNQPSGHGNVALVELGDARQIEAAVDRWRQAVARRADKGEMDQAATELSRLIWKPLLVSLADCHRAYICPDGPLAFVPFGALPGSNAGTFLIDDYELTCVASGRDLVRSGPTSNQPAVLVGDPDFDANLPARPSTAPAEIFADSGAIGAMNPSAIRGLGLSRFARLPGTRDEVSAIGHELSSRDRHPRLLTGAQASEAAVKSVIHPSILHLATHGFFLPDSGFEEALSEAQSRRGLGNIITSGAGSAESACAAAVWKKLREGNAMRRSGIALAGVNRTLEGHGELGGDDGLLTAEEVAAMDLWGTQLVTISACESGLGQSVGNEGIFGLRRAFTLAGAQNQIMSLWPVSDRQTSELMIATYRYLDAGQTPARSLLRAQRDYLAAERKAGRYPHPFYWAAFVNSGIGTGLDSR